MGIVLLERPAKAAGCAEVRFSRRGDGLSSHGRRRVASGAALSLPSCLVIYPSGKPGLVDLANRTAPRSWVSTDFSGDLQAMLVFAARARAETFVWGGLT
jgi:hypothetical protein